MTNEVNWQPGWREEVWSRLDSKWDVIIVGGGITGAGILQEIVRAGFKALLVEAQDFSAGTSSRSSKLVHGGFRYMANAQFRLTYESVHERERLLKGGAGLINQLDILMPGYPGNKVSGWALGFGLGVYSLMAGRVSYRHLNKAKMLKMCPVLCPQDLRGGFQYYDANTDDARLTFRVIREAVAMGGTALNYAKVIDLLQDSHGKVCGVVLEDQADSGKTSEVQASLVINATGAWADKLRGKLGRETRLRPLQGSHLVLPFERLPLLESVSLFHPRDGRPVFTLPWEGVTLVGTTDLDSGQIFSDSPAIQEAEVSYLLEFLQFAFPDLGFWQEDILCTFSGIRPVINTGKEDPSKESREHAIWLEENLLTVTGGKLTTFRLMARDVMKQTLKVLGGRHHFNSKQPIFEAAVHKEIQSESIGGEQYLRLTGRYGVDILTILNDELPGEQEKIETTPYCWSEVRWASRMEGIVHLDDLLLRRVRLGLQLPEGGKKLLPRIRKIVQAELKWDDKRWMEEERRYLAIWDSDYKLK